MLNVELKIDGRPAVLRLVPPTFARSLSYLVEPSLSLSQKHQDLYRRLELRHWLPADLSDEQRTAITFDPENQSRIRAARGSYLTSTREQGRAFLRCAHCESEVSLALIALAVATGGRPWPITNALGELVPPSLAYGLVPTRRPTLPLARAVRVTLAEHDVVLTPHDPARVRDLQREWELDPVTAPLDRVRWNKTSAAFRAATHLIDAARNSALSPTDVDALSLAEFLFADAVYHFVFTTELQARPEASLVKCSSCDKEFSVFGEV